MTYLCKTCRSSQDWIQCTNCGKLFCRKCALKGNGGYPIMKASNNCPYCNKLNKLNRLTGHEDALKPYSR